MRTNSTHTGRPVDPSERREAAVRLIAALDALENDGELHTLAEQAAAASRMVSQRLRASRKAAEELEAARVAARVARRDLLSRVAQHLRSGAPVDLLASVTGLRVDQVRTAVRSIEAAATPGGQNDDELSGDTAEPEVSDFAGWGGGDDGA